MIFVSTMCYSLGKLLGYDAAVREVHGRSLGCAKSTKCSS